MAMKPLKTCVNGKALDIEKNATADQPDIFDLTSRAGEWFLSVNGHQIYPHDLRPEDVDITEIAHSLSMLCRFNGHCREFYSVAQHSLLVASVLPPEHALAGLLHDATEAYCGDMIRPIKRALPAYRDMEKGIWYAIASRFGLPNDLPAAVKEADDRMLVTERRDLLASHPAPWAEEFSKRMPYDFSIEPLPSALARREFLAMFTRLSGGRLKEGDE